MYPKNGTTILIHEDYSVFTTKGYKFHPQRENKKPKIFNFQNLNPKLKFFCVEVTPFNANHQYEHIGTSMNQDGPLQLLKIRRFRNDIRTTRERRRNGKNNKMITTRTI